MKIDRIKIIGGVFGQDGYASHIRQLSAALNKVVPVQIECGKPAGWEAHESEEMIEMLNRDFGEDVVTIAITLPPYWEMALSFNPKKFIGFLVWEGSNLPLYYKDICNDERISQIWVPSEHTKQACINTGVDEDKIHIVSHGCSNLFYPKEEIK